MSKITIEQGVSGMPLADQAERLLRRGMAEMAFSPVKPVTILLQSGDIGGVEGFRVDVDSDERIRITAQDGRGLIYGAGKLLRALRLTGDGGLVTEWTGTSIPEKPVRAMYFATHFHNFYHDAPIEEVVRYVEDLALWGCNALSVWFDMHHYSGIDTPEAQAMIARLKAILAAAERVGMGPSLTMLANEGFSSTPEDLKADWTDGHDGYFRPPGGHYHVEVCPNRPGGMAYLLEQRRAVLEAFRGINFEYIWLWPYDQGGCTCSDCTPWGSNGFLLTANAVALLIRDVFPGARIVLSTWYFDHFVSGEWEGLSKAFSRHVPEWIDYLLIDDFSGFPEYPLRNGVPGNVPAVGFPEISMEGNSPWGGFGANPRPVHWRDHWAKVKHVLQGSFPYSEGIYEDINKVLMLQLEWSPDRDLDSIIREYATGYFGSETADDVVRACYLFERDEPLRSSPSAAGPRFGRGPLDSAAEAFACISAAQTRMSKARVSEWRWRLFWLRAAIGDVLRNNPDNANELLFDYLDELVRIYHAENAERSVCPAGREACRRCVP